MPPPFREGAPWFLVILPIGRLAGDVRRREFRLLQIFQLCCGPIYEGRREGAAGDRSDHDDGVALVVAGVVVANPIVAPRSDVQIASVQLSAGTDSSGTGMFDAAFLNAIGPTPPASNNPLSVLKELISSLAADVSYFSRAAIVDAVVAGLTGVAAVSEPELTAAAFPTLGRPSASARYSSLRPPHR